MLLDGLDLLIALGLGAQGVMLFARPLLRRLGARAWFRPRRIFRVLL
jgi:hypothetical protein